MEQPMYTVVYTRSLDTADELVVKSWEFEHEADAVSLFNEKLERLMRKILNNKYLNCKISIHKNRALFKIEGTHYVVAVISSTEILDDNEKDAI